MKRSGVQFAAAWGAATAFGACVPQPAQAATNLLSNGGFESGLQGWQHFGDATPDAIADHWEDMTPTEGVLLAALGDNDQPGLLRRTVAATPGRTYHLSFDLGHIPHGGFNLLQVFWGGGMLLEVGRGQVLPFETFHYDVVAPNESPALTFLYVDNDGRWLLDNVRVVAAVPEPATWAMLILGFGLAGAAARRRRLA